MTDNDAGATVPAAGRGRLIVLSGAPGGGKTSVIQALERRGYPVICESARRYIAARTARGLSPRPPPAVFARELLQNDIAQYASVKHSRRHVFFDRGVLDSLCMLATAGALSERTRGEYLADYPYYATAFMFPPWEAIYRVDAERDQSYQESVAVHTLLENWYAACGYDLVAVPRTNVEQRCDFILQILAAPNAGPS